MGKGVDELRSLFNSRIRESGITSYYAEITDVNEAARTCTVDRDGIEYEDVLLYSVEQADLKGFVCIPTIGSTVIVSQIGGAERYFVSMFSEIDKVLFTVRDKVQAEINADLLTYANNKVSLKITGNDVELQADQIILNGGSFDGLVKVRELEKNLDSLKSFAEAIHAALPAAFTAVGAALAAAGVNGAASYSGAMAEKVIQIVDMENKEVKH